MENNGQPPGSAAGGQLPAQWPTPPQPPPPPPGYSGYYGYPPYYAPPIAQPYLAGFWWRFLAAFIDGVVVGIPMQFLTLPLSAQLSRTAIVNASSGSADILAFYRNSLPAYLGLTLVSVLITVLYEGLLIGKWHGQTVGKRICNLRVVRDDGGEVSLGRAFARAAMKLVSGWALYLGYLWMLWDPKKQTWHDKVAHTLVIKE